MIAIGVSGYIRAGKDTVASYLIRRHGFVKVAWADKLKLEVVSTLSLTLHQYVKTWYPERVAAEGVTAVIHDLIYVNRDPVSRALLQEWGTELRRAEDPEYWLKAWWRDAQRHARVVIPDTRFVNEAETIRGHGGYLVRVIRPGTGPLEGAQAHRSETEMADWPGYDVVIENDSSVAALEDQVERWLQNKGLLDGAAAR